jgi:hypothetical protein
MIAALDTLQTAKRLKEAGFDEAQAEALTGVLRDAREIEQGQLATKADIDRLAEDIERLGADTKADIVRLAAATKGDIEALDAKIDTRIERLSAEFKAEIALLRSEMEILRRDVTIRLGSMIVVATGVLLAAKFFG